MMHSALNNTKLSAYFGVNAFREVHDSEDLLTDDGIACREIYTVHTNKSAFVSGYALHKCHHDLRDQFLILETPLGVYIESNAMVLKGIAY